jgi:hypothetical protein
MTKQSPHDEPTNVQRAQWAKNALDVFIAETDGDEPDSMHPSDLEDAICDLICDLMHLAHFHPRMDPAVIHARALTHFDHEIAEAQTLAALGFINPA